MSLLLKEAKSTHIFSVLGKKSLFLSDIQAKTKGENGLPGNRNISEFL